jgi:hypothetical protein
MEEMQSVLDLVETKLEDQVHSQQFIQCACRYTYHRANQPLLLRYMYIEAVLEE